MPSNIEIKARIESIADLLQKASAISDEGPIEIDQDDTFFHCTYGRLKLRVFSQGEGELIFYRRTDEEGPKESFYLRSPTSDPETLRQALTLAYGQAGRVRKHRTLFISGRTRIHLDDVDGLGCFLELEVVLETGEDPKIGVREAEDLMLRLNIDPARLVEVAYVDLLKQH